MHLNVSGDFAFNQDLYDYGLMVSQYGGTTFNLFTLFVVYYFNPPELRSYKWFLFVYQLFSTLLDFAMDTLARPIFFFPYMAGTCTGWLRTIFNVPTFWVSMMTFGSLSINFICFLPLFFRWQVLLDEGSWLKLTQKGKVKQQVYGNLLGSATLLGFLSMPYESPEKALGDFAGHNPADSVLVGIDGFYVVNGWSRPAIVIISNCCTLFWISFLIFNVIYMSIDCVKILNNSRSHMSQRTREMHVRFLRNLFFQTGIPMLFLEIPVLMWLILMAFDIRFPGHQNLNNLTVWCTCVHGAFGSIFVFYLNPMYVKCIKTAAFDSFRKYILRLPETRLLNVSVVAPTSMIQHKSSP